MNQSEEVLARELKIEILKLENALSQLDADLNLLQNGDFNEVYWNGPGAYSFIKSCLGYCDHNKYLLKQVSKCSDYINSLVEEKII